jgi:hypothetical protein
MLMGNVAANRTKVLGELGALDEGSIWVALLLGLVWSVRAKGDWQGDYDFFVRSTMGCVTSFGSNVGEFFLGKIWGRATKLAYLS